MRSFSKKQLLIIGGAILVAILITLSLTSCSPTQRGAYYFRNVPNGQKIATCIINRESGGNPTAISPTRDYGLFQINRAAHRANFERMYGRSFDKYALTVDYNGKYARYLYDYYRSRGMSGWTPWKGGRYSCF